MVTDEERDYMYNQYAKDPKMRINVGIRRRLAPLVENNRNIIEMLNSILFSFPGTPIIYYGDEIGMGDNIYLGDRDGVRTPMQWSLNRNAGFSQALPQQLYLPPIMDYVYGYQSINVENQLAQPSSLLNFIKKIISVRKEYKVFGQGDIEFLKLKNNKILAYTRSYREQNILCLVNLSKTSEFFELDLLKYDFDELKEIFGENLYQNSDGKKYSFSMQPYSFFWFEIKKVSEE